MRVSSFNIDFKRLEDLLENVTKPFTQTFFHKRSLTQNFGVILQILNKPIFKMNITLQPLQDRHLERTL